MCISNPSETGHGEQFIPCKQYNELLEKHIRLKRDYNALVDEKVREEWEYANEIPDGGNS